VRRRFASDSDPAEVPALDSNLKAARVHASRPGSPCERLRPAEQLADPVVGVEARPPSAGLELTVLGRSNAEASSCLFDGPAPALSIPPEEMRERRHALEPTLAVGDVDPPGFNARGGGAPWGTRPSRLRLNRPPDRAGRSGRLRSPGSGTAWLRTRAARRPRCWPCARWTGSPRTLHRARTCACGTRH